MRTIICFTLVLSMLSCPGCTQQKEVQKLAIVGILAFDKVTEEGKDQYQASILVYKPIEMSSGKEGGGPKSSPYVLNSAMGSSLAEALKKLTLHSSRFIIFSHTELIILGERLIREDGIEKLLDLTLRNLGLRLTNYVLVSKGKAVDILEAEPWQEPTLSQEIVREIERLKEESFYYVPEFIQFSLTSGIDPLLGNIQIQSVPEKLRVGKENRTERVSLTGAVAIREKELGGWLNDEEVKGFLFVVNQIEGGPISVRLPDEAEGSFTCQILKSTAEIQPVFQDEELSMIIDVKIRLEFLDIEGKETISNQLETDELNEQIEEEIVRMILSAVQTSQDYKSDIFGFGTAIHRKYPDQWQDIEEDWIDIYPDLAIEVNVEAKIHEPGMITNPLEVK